MGLTLECIGELHRFDVASGARAPACPVCGSLHVRLAGRHGSQEDVPDANAVPRLTVTREDGRHKVGGGTWLDDRQKFVEMVKRLEPAMSDVELSRCVTNWFGRED